MAGVVGVVLLVAHIRVSADLFIAASRGFLDGCQFILLVAKAVLHVLAAAGAHVPVAGAGSGRPGRRADRGMAGCTCLRLAGLLAGLATHEPTAVLDEAFGLPPYRCGHAEYPDMDSPRFDRHRADACA